MGEFFRGWRRKIGCVTLVIACVLMVGWVRCQTIAEVVQVGIGNRNFYLLSVDDKLHLGVQQPGGGWHQWGWVAEPSSNTRFRIHVNRDPDVDLRLCGAGLVSYGTGGAGGKIELRFPYWSINIPLTLLSAYLLLTKHWQSTPKRITEPIPAEGA